MAGIFHDLQREKSVQNKKVIIEKVSQKEIAVIGMSGRIAQAEDLAQFCKELSEGNSMIQNISKEREEDIHAFMENFPALKYKEAYQKMGYLKDIDKFDYSYFQIAPSEARTMAPEQRLLLENVMHTVEDSGYGNRIRGMKTGVYVGYSDDALLNYQTLIYANQKTLPLESLTGNIRSVLAGRISYYLNLKGPAIVFDTACSSSLVALHYACEDLQLGRCSTAIVAGVSLKLLPLSPDTEGNVGILSKEQRTRTFDDQADGTVNGEAVASILLKPLHRALEDNDKIYAVIKGSAVNQDGYSNGISAPNAKAQEEVIVSAWRDANINPEWIEYIEAHGTGTKLGDPVEIEGIRNAFETFTKQKQFCAISSLKTNIGHTDSAAGMCSLIKCILSLKYNVLFPSLNFEKPNRQIDFVNSPLYVNTEFRKWESKQEKRLCGLNAFGLSGTNCHVVLEEYKEERKREAKTQNWNLLAISAKTQKSLEQMVFRHRKYLAVHEEADLEQYCYTANVRKEQFAFRKAFIIQDNGNFYEYPAETSQLTAQNQKVLELSEYAEKYLRGESVDFSKLYQKSIVPSDESPLYAFERTRCWETGAKMKKQESLYQVTWREKYPDQKPMKKKILLVAGENQYTRQVVKKLRERACQVTVVRIADTFQKLDEHMFQIANTKESYKMLFQEIGIDSYDQIVHAVTLDNTGTEHDIEVLNRNMERGFENAFHLVKAFNEFCFQKNIEIILLSHNSNPVGNGTVIPENKAFGSIGKSIMLEQPNIEFHFIDFDFETGSDTIAEELQYSKQEYEIVYRNNKRMVAKIQEVSEGNKAAAVFKENGTYVITGGLGDLGLVVANHIADTVKANIVLLGRTALPYKESWKDEALHNDKINELLAIEKKGATVAYISADVTRQESLEAAFLEIRQKFGAIHGVIHAAGIAGRGLFLNKELEQAESVIAPKIKGTFLLNQVTREDKLDFMLLFSSVTSLLGGLGQSDYTVGNAYLDSFQGYHKTYTVNWPAWKETGMAVRNGLGSDEAEFLYAISNQSAMELMDQILAGDADRQVIAGALNYQALGHVADIFSEEICERIPKADIQSEAETVREESELEFPEDCGYTQIQKEVFQIWYRVLGVKDIGLGDIFHDVGGNSILAVKMFQELDKKYPGVFEVTDIFSVSTVRDMANAIERAIQKEHEEVDMEEILSKLAAGDINEEEVDKLLFGDKL